MRNAVIISSGMHAPARVLDNQYFNDLLGEDVDTWLRENVEIYSRRWCAENESTADLVEAAARQALENAGLGPEKLDLIIVATDTPEFISPSTASVLQHRLGAANAGTFDLNTACAGFVTALDTASKYIKADENYRYILVIGAYAMSKYLNLQDKKTVTLFADGAGAVILKAEESDTPRGFLASQLITHGEYHGWMGIYGGGSRQPVTHEVVERHEHQLQFVKRFPPTLNPEIWSEMIHTVSNRANLQIQDISQFFFTQININSIRATMDKIGVSHNRAHTIMHEYGYTGSACIPMAFHDAFQKGKVNPGDHVFFIGSGGGLAFAAAAFKL